MTDKILKEWKKVKLGEDSRVMESIPSNLYELLIPLIGYNRGVNFAKALSEFIHKEQFLLEEGLNERSLTHKLAEYLQKYFPDYNVDCEYNRMENGKTYEPKKLELEKKETIVCPDIIIHKRGNNEDNLLVIEVKKSSNSDNKDFDFKKLKAFTTQLNYRLGIYLEFDEESIFDFAIFNKGKCIYIFSEGNYNE